MDETPIEILGWETAEIDAILDLGAAPNEAADVADDVPEQAKIAVSGPVDLWQLGKHRLLCGSSVDAGCWERLLAAPRRGGFYRPTLQRACLRPRLRPRQGPAREFALASGEMSKGEFTTSLTVVGRKMVPHLKEGAILELCMDWRHCGELLNSLDANTLTLINLCVWNKTNGSMGSLFRSKHELVFIAKKGSAPHTNNVELGKHGRYRTNVWDYAGINTFGKGRLDDLADHPTVEAIRDVTHPGEINLDAFSRRTTRPRHRRDVRDRRGVTGQGVGYAWPGDLGAADGQSASRVALLSQGCGRATPTSRCDFYISSS